MRQKIKKRWLAIVALAMMALVGGTLFWPSNPVEAAHTHSYRWVVKKAATCTSEGYKNYECSCGACSGSQTIPKTPHNFNVNAATCTTAKKCRTCGYVAQGATGHSWNRGSATCTASKSCTKCGAIGQNALGHCYVQVTTKQPTCGASGTYETKCSRCGIGSPTGNGSIPPTGAHSWDRSEATCTAAKKCKTCGAIGQAAKGHNYYWVEVVSPTCTQVGRRDLRCATCGYVSDSQTLDKVPSHNMVLSEQVKADCSHDGYDVYQCSNGCGYTEKRNVIKAKAHDFKWVEVETPNCTKTGRRDYKCRNCGYVTKSQTLEKVPNHDMVFSKHVAGDSTHDTYDVYNCSRCGYTENRNVLSSTAMREVMSIINQKMIKKNNVGNVIGTYYTPQMWRIHDDGEEGGICTWCAITNLLNRKLALENDAFATTTRFTISDTAYVASGKKEKYIEDYNKAVQEKKKAIEPKERWAQDYTENGTKITIANYNGSDHYDNVFFNSDDTHQYTMHKKNFNSSNVESKKAQVKELLDAHPEGIVVQYQRWKGTYDSEGNKVYHWHGFVISGYYYNDTKLCFYVVDTGTEKSYASYKEGNNTRMEDAWIGNGYGNGNNADTIFKYLIYYLALD